MQTPRNVSLERHVPLHVKVSYINELGELIEDSETASILIRQRSFFEIGSPNGIWIGDLFVPFTFGIGTIITIGIGVVGWFFGIKRWLKRLKRSGRLKF